MHSRLSTSKAVTRLGLLHVLALLASLFALTGCASKESQELADARGRWNDKVGALDYEFLYSTGGASAHVVERIYVHAGVVETVFVDGAPRRVTSSDPTMPKLFDEIEQWGKGSADITVHYDPTFGFPAHAQYANDGEMSSFEVSEVTMH